MALLLHIYFTSKSTTTGSDHDKEENIETRPPCSTSESEILEEIQSCCKVFDGIFRRSNIQQIMSLMKYSLDISNPWISQYFHNYTDAESTQSAGSMRDMYKIWLAENNDELLELFSSSDDLNFLRNFG